jgi:hypothetical protein
MTNSDLYLHQNGLEEQIWPTVSVMLHSITSTDLNQQWEERPFYFFTE